MIYYHRDGTEEAQRYAFTMMRPLDWKSPVTHTRPWSQWDVKNLKAILEEDWETGQNYGTEDTLRLRHMLTCIMNNLDEARKELRLE